MKILLTTPDYPPKLGGLSTLTLHIEEALKKIGAEVDLFVWDNVGQITLIEKNRLTEADYILNIHFNFGLGHSEYYEKMLNIVHGSEALMTSPHFLKRLIKRLFKKKYLAIFEQSKFNIFISYSTQKKVYQRGLKSDYSRDLVFHNCIDTSLARFYPKNLADEKLIFILIARNVPHKNFEGTKIFLNKLSQLTGKKIILQTTFPDFFIGNKFEVKAIGKKDSERNEAYQQAHFNLLFSLDHSKLGFYEGFGLTVLEASLWGTPSLVLRTGGLPEAVHDGYTGKVFQTLDEDEIASWWSQMNQEAYEHLSLNTFQHTKEEHSLENYQRLFQGLL